MSIPKKKRSTHIWVRTKLKDIALKRLAHNRGYALSVGGPGEREEISGVENYLVREQGRVFVKQNDGNCMSAAITNVVDCVAGREVGEALKEYFFEENPHYSKIREATLLLHDLATGVGMRKIPKCDRELSNENPFAYLASRESGVYVVHIFQLKLVSHVIVVDATRKLIIDSAEEYPMRLSEELLRKCGGDEADTLRIG